jgi:hypothetical protein
VVNSQALRPIEYILASHVKTKGQWESDLGLVIISVDVLYMGAGWIVSQIHADGEFQVFSGQ